MMEQPPCQEAINALSKDHYSSAYMENLAGAVTNNEGHKAGGKKSKEKEKDEEDAEKTERSLAIPKPEAGWRFTT